MDASAQQPSVIVKPTWVNKTAGRIKAHAHLPALATIGSLAPIPTDQSPLGHAYERVDIGRFTRCQCQCKTGPPGIGIRQPHDHTAKQKVFTAALGGKL